MSHSFFWEMGYFLSSQWVLDSVNTQTQEFEASIFSLGDCPEPAFHRSWIRNPPILIPVFCPVHSKPFIEGMVTGRLNRPFGLPFLWAPETEEMVWDPRFLGGEAWKSSLMLIRAPWGNILGMRSPCGPKAILEAGFIEDKELICFFPVRGLAFTSLKVGVGHRLDSQASGVLGRWCGEPGVQW